MFVTFFFQSDIIFYQLFLIYLSAKIIMDSTHTHTSILTRHMSIWRRNGQRSIEIQELGQFQYFQKNWKFLGTIVVIESRSKMDFIIKLIFCNEETIFFSIPFERDIWVISKSSIKSLRRWNSLKKKTKMMKSNNIIKKKTMNSRNIAAENNGWFKSKAGT